ncbi:peptidoglycan DD-metalloendopeptidase family protein [Draconibacterium sp. IB214405]|uniref:M23 family metallopeptidase n=1 Tax=Draconibacterium sp. IB214405 TaxID=3097352 RepID=UPI002A13A474|nr:peptidoglycan DD-metalloendopeptidase family protein [Draconibacterium sp. IB214405]MDX8338629.1 peptidoglycan DD-metalloendopeptidase family protein [Draconibacterium sp. IB214405]
MGKLRSIFVGMGLVIVLSQLFSCAPKNTKQADTPVLDTVVEVKMPVLKYGLPVDSFTLEMGKVKNNQYLSQILNARGVGMGTIDKIARKSRDVFDVRKIKSGENFCILSTRDSVPVAKYFVYENSPVQYTVFELTDSLGIYQGAKEVKTRQRTAHGVVESSLWNAMVDNGQDPVLSLELSKIYAWTIDFFGIQKGDRYRLIYDEEYVDSVSIGIGNIYAVEFEHYGEPNYAYWFKQDSIWDYYDDKGNSLRKEFLKAPLEFYRISSRFSNGRMHPVLRIRRPHHGVDYAAPKGTPVMTIGDGTVIAKAYQKGGGGNYLKIKHNHTYTTTYMHLSGYAKGISTGSRVRQGDVIGYVGATGLATGPHLDFRVHMNGRAIDPLKMKADPVDPVDSLHMERFTLLKDSLMLELQKIQWDDLEQILANSN